MTGSLLGRGKELMSARPIGNSDSGLSLHASVSSEPESEFEDRRSPAALAKATTEESVERRFGGRSSSADSMVQTVERLQEIAATDEQAHAHLMQELRRAPLTAWPPIVEQFHTAYSAGRRHGSAQHGRITSAGNNEVAQRSNDQDTSRIGQLVDPRRIRKETSGQSVTESESTTAIVTDGHGSNRASDTGLLANAYYSIAGEEGGPEAHGFVTPVAAHLPGERYLPPRNLRSQASGRNVDRNQLGVEPAHFVVDSARPLKSHEELLEASIDQLVAQLDEYPHTSGEVVDHVRLRMLELVAGRTSEAVRPVTGIPPVEQDYWSRQLLALATFMDDQMQSDQSRRAATAALHLEEALGNLREQATLSVRNLVFCKEVYDYGAYEIESSHRFAPGRQIALYAEVENFRSHQTESGYHTSLASSYEILDEDGNRVDGREFPNVEDDCRRRRRDFHIQYGFTIPKEIKSGRYQLQLIIKDNLSDKIGRNSIEFEVTPRSLLGRNS